MEIEKTKLTSKYQTTVPYRIRKRLNLSSGEEVYWHLIREFVILDTHKKIKNPVEFLTSKIKLSVDAVKLVNASREEFA